MLMSRTPTYSIDTSGHRTPFHKILFQEPPSEMILGIGGHLRISMLVFCNLTGLPLVNKPIKNNHISVCDGLIASQARVRSSANYVYSFIKFKLKPKLYI